jgi:hypothetical protein
VGGACDSPTTTSARRAWTPTGTSSVGRLCHDRDSGYDLGMASAIGRAEVDICEGPSTLWRAPRDSPVRRPHGGRESHLGIYSDPRRPQESGTSRRAIDYRSYPQGEGHSAGTGTADVVADIHPRAVGRDRGRGFLHNRSVDLAGLDDVLHRIRHPMSPPVASTLSGRRGILTSGSCSKWPARSLRLMTEC